MNVLTARQAKGGYQRKMKGSWPQHRECHLSFFCFKRNQIIGKVNLLFLTFMYSTY